MSAYNKTYASNPDLWDEGISFLMKCAYADGSQGVIASGWHLRSIEFEHHEIKFERNSSGFGVRYIDTRGDIETPWDGITKFEIEVSLNNAEHSSVTELLSHLIPQEMARACVDSMATMIQRISAQKANAPVICGSEVIQTVDLLCQNLPARSGDMTEPLRALYRWCRIFALPNGTLTIYQPIADEQKSNLRWPHNGIWLNRATDYYRQPTEVGKIKTAFEIPILYEEYNLANWRIEFEFWENQPFQIMVSDNSDLAAQHLRVAQREIGILSQFVTYAFMATRNLEHKSQYNPLVAGNADLRNAASKHVDHLTSVIEEYRTMLETASGLLANTAQSVQAIANQESAQTLERTNAFIAYASAVFFIPTLIISFFSMSIIGLDRNTAVPSTLSVFFLCLFTVIVALIVILLARFVIARSRRTQTRAKEELDHVSTSQ